MPPNILMDLAIGGLTMRTIRLGNSDLEVGLPVFWSKGLADGFF
jgi:hypothetical protein